MIEKQGNQMIQTNVAVITISNLAAICCSWKRTLFTKVQQYDKSINNIDL